MQLSGQLSRTTPCGRGGTADALDLGSSKGDLVGVQVPPPAPTTNPVTTTVTGLFLTF